MKKCSLICCVIILSISISSCSIVHKNNLSQTAEKENSVSAIKDVIQNKKEFLNAENGKSIYLKDFHSGNYLSINDKGQNEYTSDAEQMDFNFDKFNVIDIDGDGYPEILLEESQFGHILIFHYENGIVYGFVFPFRGMENVKKDASFVGSGGATINSVKKVKFSKGNVNFIELCRCDGWNNIYRINGKNVSKEDATKCLKRSKYKGKR